MTINYPCIEGKTGAFSGAIFTILPSTNGTGSDYWLAVGPVYPQIAVKDPIHAAPDEAGFPFVDRVAGEIPGNGVSFPYSGKARPEKLAPTGRHGRIMAMVDSYGPLDVGAPSGYLRRAHTPE